MRNAGPLFRNALVASEAIERHVVAVVAARPTEASDRERLAADFADFERRAPIVDVLEVVREERDGHVTFHAKLACGHVQGAGGSGRHARIRCGACFAALGRFSSER